MYNHLFYFQKTYDYVVGTLTLQRNLIAERERWSLWPPVIWACGIALYFSLSIEPPGWSGFSVVLVAIALIFMLRRRGLLILFPITMLIVAAGFTSIQLRSVLVSAPVLEKELGPITITGELLSLQPKSASQRLLLHHLAGFPIDPDEVPERVRVNVNAALPSGLLPGQRVRVKVVLRPPPEPAAPGSFDFARQAYFKKLGAVGYAISKVEIIEPSPASASNGLLVSWSLFWDGLRIKIDRRVAAVLEGEKGAIASALITGLRGGVSARTQEVMRDAGLAHLLAISGLHMGIVSGWIFLLSGGHWHCFLPWHCVIRLRKGRLFWL